MKLFLLWTIFLSVGLTKAQKIQKPLEIKSSPSGGVYIQNASRVDGVPYDDDDDGNDFDEGSGESSLVNLSEVSQIGEKTLVNGSQNLTRTKEGEISVDDDNHDYGEEEDDANDPEGKLVGTDSPIKPSNETDAEPKDSMYDYDYEVYEDDDDYDDNEEGKSTVPPVTPLEDRAKSNVPDDKNVTSEVKTDEETSKDMLTTFYVSLIAGSAIITFTILMLGFFIYRRTLRNKSKNVLEPFNESPPACVLTSSSSPIVKSYRKVPASANETLMDQEESSVSLDSKTKFPLLS